MPIQATLLLRNASLLDGSGAPARFADVLIGGGRIEAVGKIAGAAGAAEQIDLAGLMLAPGFIDLHTHSDVSLLRDGRAESQLLQGVTTEVVGNCGHSCAPIVRGEDAQRLTFGPRAEAQPCWRSFADYLAALEASELAVNVSALVGHAALRTAVMRDPLARAADEEIDAMADLLDRSLDEGAVGLSSGLEYVPGICADARELAALAACVARHGALYATHVRNRDVQYELGIGEAVATARASGARLQVSHIQPKFGAPAHAAERMTAMVDWARADVDAAFDVIPHTWAPTAVASVLPAWMHEGGPLQTLARLRDPAARARIKARPNPIWRLVAEGRWSDIVLLSSSANAREQGQTVAEIAASRSVEPFDAVLDLLHEDGEAFAALTWAGHNFTDDDIALLLGEPHAGVISDAITLTRDGPLGRLRWSPSSFNWTARFLQRYVRERGALDLPQAVRRLTALPAQRLGLADRGVIREGARADLVVFDAAAVADHSTLAEPNVPPSGFLHVIVNGRVAVRDGQLTGARAGQVLRGR